VGLLDFFKGGGSGGNKCAHCKKEGGSLPYSKKLDGGVQKFCSKQCSRQYRIDRKKKPKGPETRSSMPW